MYCKNCGAKLIENDSFCKNCGTPVTIQNNVEVNQQTFTQNEFNNVQQPVNNKKRKKVLLSIIGALVLGIILFVVIFYIECNQYRPWQSGEIKILGKNIQLPCDVDTFELLLNTKIIDAKYSEDIKNVKINLDNDSVLIFDVFVEDNNVTGIILDAYSSGANRYNTSLPANERNIANKIIFPGNVSIDTSIEEIKKLYSTKPFNVNYTYFDEEIGYENKYLSAHHKYQNDNYSIEISTDDGEITEITYSCCD